MVSLQANPGHVLESGGAARWRADGFGRTCLLNELRFGFRDVGNGGGDSMSRTDGAGGSFANTEAIFVGTSDERAARKDRRGLEKEGEERTEWVVGGDTKTGEFGAESGGIRRRVYVSGGGGEGGGGGGTGGGDGRDMPENGGWVNAVAVAGEGIVSPDVKE